MKLFIERPVATAMAFLAVLVLGVHSFLNTPLELAPSEEFPRLEVQTAWPGVSPETVQARLTAPLEALSSAVRGVRKISSVSRSGMSTITLEIDPRANLEFVNLALGEALAGARPTLPDGARPVVRPYVPEDLRLQPFLRYAISGDHSPQELRELVKDKLEFGIGSVRNIAKVEVTGGADPELRIVLDRRRLEALGLQPYEVDHALSEGLRSFPAGRLKRGTREFVVRVSESIQGRRDLEELVVAHSGSPPVRLGDVARVVPAWGEIPSLNRLNGRPTVTLTVLKEKGSHSLRVAREVKTKLELIKRELPPDLSFKVVDDESGEIRRNLRQLALLAGVITAVVFLLILVVLRRPAPSLLILSSIAFSVVITFNLISIFKLSLNMLTLGALALGFGMFVDDSIVVFENILRLRERGLAPAAAAVQGSREVFLPVFASTLTVVSVFFCFPYFQGRLRIYYLPLAIVMAAALTASLLVSFSLIPALSPRLLRLPRRAAKSGKGCAFERALRFFLRHPVEVLLVVLALLYGSYRWFRKEVTVGEFFRWSSRERLYLSLALPPGTEIETTDGLVRAFERRVFEAACHREMNSSITPENASIVISFPPEVERSHRPYALKESLIRLATRFAGLTIGVFGFDDQAYSSGLGAGTFPDSRITFFGYNLGKLREITAELEARLKRNPRIRDVKTISSRDGWWGRGQDSLESVLKIDRGALTRYRSDPADLYFYIQMLLPGRFAAPLRIFADGRETELRIMFPETQEINLNELRDTRLETDDGEGLRLGEILRLAERPIAGSIDRENQRFQQTLMWEFRGPRKAAENTRQAIFSSLALPPGFSASLDDERRFLTEGEKSAIKSAIIVSLVIIFMILAALYESFLQPLFIMPAVPLALAGVFVAFVIARFPFDSSAHIGLIILGGIVVKNAILVVDHINLKRRQGLALLEAVLQGTGERLRPVFLTTGTTVSGSLPLLLTGSEAGRPPIWSALALCTAGGLVSSAIFVLIVVPIFYYYGERLRPGIARKSRDVAQAPK